MASSLNIEKQGLLSLLGLITAFLLSFALPIIFALKAADYYFSPSSAEIEDEAPFPESIAVSGQGIYRRIVNTPALNPVAGEDFVLSGWFKLSRFPERGQKVMLFSKFDAETPAREGYALSISRDLDQLRPAVYWRDREGKGGWYTFSEIELSPRRWFMLTVSVREGRYLGLHAAQLKKSEEHPPLTLLGGYDLEQPVLAASAADLLTGSWAQNQYRGEIGPAAVLSGRGLTEELKPLLKSLSRSPLELPDSVPKETVKLWSSGHDARDGVEGDSAPALEIIGASKPRRERPGGAVQRPRD